MADDGAGIGTANRCRQAVAFGMRTTFAVAAATVGGLVMIGMTIWVQVWEVPAAADEFNEADVWIGPHCTVAPGCLILFSR